MRTMFNYGISTRPRPATLTMFLNVYYNLLPLKPYFADVQQFVFTKCPPYHQPPEPP